MRPAIAGNFAPHPHMAEFILDPPLQGGGEFGDSQFNGVGQGCIIHTAIEPVLV